MNLLCTVFVETFHILVQVSKSKGVHSGEENMTILVNRKVIRGMKGGHIVTRFDTAFNDRNFESYYCVLKSSSPLDKLHVIEHSIPFFLPVRELEKQHLGNSPKMFLDYMGDVLQAYVSRREQVRR